ncbi:MAG: hypothetical protein V4681_03935 [Patescibacteria group bacterium]
MMYLVDFAGTLFDTAAFDAYMKGREAEQPFAPGELAQFLYPDAAGFLRDKGNSAMVITAMDKEYGASKIENALSGIPRIAVIYTAGKAKGEYLAPHISMYGTSPVFVDDSVEQLENMSSACPGVQVFQILRDGTKEDGRWSSVRTLSELP